MKTKKLKVRITTQADLAKKKEKSAQLNSAIVLTILRQAGWPQTQMSRSHHQGSKSNTQLFD